MGGHVDQRANPGLPGPAAKLGGGKRKAVTADKNHFGQIGDPPADEIDYKKRFHQGNHFETVPSASSGGKIVLRKPFSQ